MDFFRFISYFIKSFIRVFTRKFFWFIFFGLLVLFFWLFFNRDVNAATSNYSFEYGNLDDVSRAQQIVGSSIWNNTNYDIFIYYDPNTNYGATVLYFDVSTLSDYTTYRVNTDSNDEFYGFNVLPFYFINKQNNSSVYNYATDYHIKTINNNNRNDYYENFAPESNPDWGSNLFGNKTSSKIFVHVVRSHFDFVDINNNVIYSATNPVFTSPYIVNSNDITNWSFDTFNVSLGSISYDSNNSYYLRYTLNGNDYGIELVDYYNSSLGYFVVPRNQLTNNVVVRNNDTFDFTLIYRSLTTVTPYELGTFTISITSEEQEQINQDSEKSVQGQILEQQQQTNDKLDDINNTQQQTNDKIDNLDNTITDSNIDDITNDSLPSDNTNDITSEGVNGIFTSIYNAFCTGDTQDIVFPIPFTNKNISLSADYVSSSLENSGANFVIVIVQAFWWYLISRFIIKDVMNKINKIKSGNIEDIETTNIRGDML